MLAAGIAGGNPANILPVYSSAGNVLFAVVALQRGCYAQQAWYARIDSHSVPQVPTALPLPKQLLHHAHQDMERTHEYYGALEL